jgi:hypothetical protein
VFPAILRKDRDSVMTDADEAQKIFEHANIAIQAAISTLGRTRYRGGSPHGEDEKYE